MAVRTHREGLDYTSPDGVVYPLHVPSTVGKWVINEAGWGLPPIEYQTQRGPFQHGETVTEIFLRPRIIQLLIRQQYCSRDDYWAGRAGILDSLRFNRQAVVGGTTPGQLRRTLPDGSQRCLDVFLSEGPRFEPRQLGRWDEWAFQEVLRFTAFNPVAYDPTLHSSSLTATDVSLVFPIEFPITFGGFEESTTLVYAGTWPDYPTIQINGPMLRAIITNLTIGEQIDVLATLLTGQYLTIDLAYGRKTVTKNDGSNLIGGLSSDSDLATWRLEPAPQAAGGNNNIYVQIFGGDPSSSVTFRWHSRYIGI